VNSTRRNGKGIFGTLATACGADDAQGIAEYAVLLAIILAVSVTALAAVAGNSNALFTKAANKLAHIAR
jgi:Flp pilus assembly pilin Flp